MNDSQRLIRLQGPLTLTTLFRFQEALRSESSPVTILDLTNVPYIDSAGLGSLVNGYVSHQRHGRRLVLVGVSERVRNLLRITKVEQLFETFATLAQAEDALRSKGT